VEFRLAGYNAWRDTVVVYADQPETVPSVQLTQADGRVELTTNPEGAAVSVNGQFQGQTPLTLRLNPGREHSINVTKPGFEPVTQVLSVAADSGRRVSVDLVAQFGVVDISSEPSGAEIWVDGENAGATPQQLTLSASSHRAAARRLCVREHAADAASRLSAGVECSARTARSADGFGLFSDDRDECRSTAAPRAAGRVHDGLFAT
jgi:hypothetical protein